MIPLTSLNVKVQQMVSTLLSDKQRRQFEELFPLFNTAPRQVKGPSGVGHEAPYNLRRFSAGANLPRGRYYGLIDSLATKIHASFTNLYGHSPLVGELLIYSHNTSSNWTSAFDLSLVDLPPGILNSEEQEAVDAVNGQMIAVFERPLAADLKFNSTNLFPYQVSTLNRQRAFDLRRAEALDWLIQTLNEDFPNALFMDIDPHDTEAEMMYIETVNSLEQRQKLIDQLPLPLSKGLHGINTPLGGLADMLSYLLTETLGGSPMLDIISALALRSGADCIVFPSARVDCGVAYCGGEIESWWGWNLVDLAGATSSYTDRVVLVACPEAKYTRSEMTVVVDSLDPKEPYPVRVSDMRLWAAEGLSQHTMDILHTRRWIEHLNGHHDIGIPILEVERTFRKGRFSQYQRKPKRFRDLSALRSALVNQEIRLESRVLVIDGNTIEHPGPLGDFLAQLCAQGAFLNSESRSTVYCGSWFLLQSPTITSYILLCPCCGARQRIEGTIDFQRIACCSSCRYGHIAGQPSDEAGAQALEAIDIGMGMLWEDW